MKTSIHQILQSVSASLVFLLARSTNGHTYLLTTEWNQQIVA